MSSIFVSEATKKWAETRKKPYAFWSVTTSTNERAKQEILAMTPSYQETFFPSRLSPHLPHSFFSLPHFKLYIANHQTEGKGRYRHSWKDEGKGEALLSSWVFLLSYFPQHMKSLFVGMVLFRSLKRIWPHLSWSLKPPNDIYLGEKKMGGLLLESFSIFRERSQASTSHFSSDFKKPFCLTIGLGLNIFSCPQNEKNATFLGKEEFSLGKYFHFLDLFYRGLVWVSKNAFRTTLKKSERNLLKTALKSYPHIQYKDVSLKGDVMMENTKIAWRDL